MTQSGIHVFSWLPEAFGCGCFRGPSQAEGLFEANQDLKAGSLRIRLKSKACGAQGIANLIWSCGTLPGTLELASV